MKMHTTGGKILYELRRLLLSNDDTNFDAI
jgi:hypothetical protein